MDGKIIIRLRTDNKTGKFEAKILGHEGGAKCSDGIDEALLRDILEAEIPGFGDMVKVTDASKTNEFFQEKQNKKETPQINPNDPVFPEEEEEEKKKGKDLSNGYGV